MTTTQLILFVIAVFILSGIRIVNEYVRSMVFRLGRFNRIAGPGIYWIIPLFEWQRTIDMRTRTVTVERQETITGKERLNFAAFITKERVNFPAANYYHANVIAHVSFMTEKLSAQ
jgi:regulator of protease activity HflC (stomatin/prohibitin superfamily)